MILALLLAVTPAQVAQRVQHFYAHTRDFSAKFAQRRVSASLGRTEDLTGTVRVKKPGLVRWDYETPEARSISRFATGTTRSPPRTYRLPPGSAKSFWRSVTMSAVRAS